MTPLLCATPRILLAATAEGAPPASRANVLLAMLAVGVLVLLAIVLVLPLLLRRWLAPAQRKMETPKARTRTPSAWEEAGQRAKPEASEEPESRDDPDHDTWPLPDSN